MTERIILIALSSQDDVEGFAARTTGSPDLDKALDRMKDLLAGFGTVDWDKAFQGTTVYYPR